MKIILLHYSAPPVVGGVESVLGHHARLMADAGHDVRIVAGRGAQMDPRIPFMLIPLFDSLHPDILAVKAELDKGIVPPKFSSLVETLSDELNKSTVGSDLVIAHNVYSLHKNLALTAALKNLVAKSARPRLILWHHDLAWTAPRYQSELHAGYPWDLLRTHVQGVCHVVVSEMRQRELADLLNIQTEQITVVPNGVDLSQFFKLESQTQAFVKQLDLMAAAPLLLIPVRITSRKNLELALKALAQLRKRWPQAMLVVTGPLGPHNPNNLQYFKHLQVLRSELGLDHTAHFLAEFSEAYLPDAVIADFYRLADALFLPSLEEGFGIPILEAGVEGLPVFCSDIPTLRALGGDEAMYFSSKANAEDVADLIIENLSSHPQYQMRIRVRQRYTWESIYDEHIAPLLKSEGDLS
jgi:glycosyltransferase involved in cell wall biosynthesis